MMEITPPHPEANLFRVSTAVSSGAFRGGIFVPGSITVPLAELNRSRVAYPLRFCFVPAYGGQAKGGNSLPRFEAADDEAVASSADGLAPSMDKMELPYIPKLGAILASGETGL